MIHDRRHDGMAPLTALPPVPLALPASIRTGSASIDIRDTFRNREASDRYADFNDRALCCRYPEGSAR